MQVLPYCESHNVMSVTMTSDIFYIRTDMFNQIMATILKATRRMDFMPHLMGLDLQQ